MNEVDEYIKSFPADVQDRLITIRSIILEAAPQAAERICMRIPTYDLYGKWLVHFAGYKKHIGALLVNDTPAAEKAFKTGIGNYADFELGGTLDKKLQRSIKVRAYVKSLHDGKYVVEGAPARGMTHDSGYTAVLRVGTIDIVVCRRMINTGDPQIFRAFGVEPSLYDLVAVKSGTQYKTEYSKFTKLFYPTDTPGSATAKLETIPTKRLPRPFYPFDEIDGYKPSIYAFSHNC